MNTVKRPIKTEILNLLAGNPVRAGISCLVFFWIPFLLFVHHVWG